jgi:hypothetical protein
MPGVLLRSRIFMALSKYRIRSPTIALLQEDESRVAHTVLAGDIVAIERQALDDDGLVEVTWNERVAMMFTQDVRSRGNRVE